MKRFAGLFLTCLILMSMTLTGCCTVSNTPNSPSIAPTKSADDTNNKVATITDAPSDKVINVFSATDEVPNIIMKYKELHPDLPYEIKMFTFATIDGDFHAILDEFLAKGGVDTPDIYCIESSKVIKYSQGNAAKYAAPYKDLGIDVGVGDAGFGFWRKLSGQTQLQLTHELYPKEGNLADVAYQDQTTRDRLRIWHTMDKININGDFRFDRYQGLAVSYGLLKGRVELTTPLAGSRC